MSDLLQLVGLAIVSMANPTLLAAVTVMLLLPSPRRLMLGYLLGAYLTSITCGVLILYALEGTSAVRAGKGTVSPAQDLVMGFLLLIVAVALGEGRGKDFRERRAARKARSEKKAGDPLPMRVLGRGSARVSFAVGLLLSFPGASYLIALGHIDRLEAGVGPSVLLVVGFCLFQQLLLELPLVGYFLAPDRTDKAVASFRSWLQRNGRRTGARFAAVLGVLLLVRALVVLISAS